MQSQEANSASMDVTAPGPDPGVLAALDLAASLAAWQRDGRRKRPWQVLHRATDAVPAVIIAFAAVGIFVLGMVAHARVSDGTVATVAPAGAPSGQQVAFAQRVDVSPDDDPVLGSKDARVTIIEFADFQCPYCGRFHAQTLPLILREYGDQVRFVFRDFPLTSIHAFAQKAAEAGECAHEQGNFWGYHDLLFQNQNALDRESLGRYAGAVGLDADAFANCLDSGKYTSEIAADLQAGVGAGVTGTPAFFINGQFIRGAQPYEVFKAAIDGALADAD